ncbi:transmembrane protein, putative [Medicago truncatula]|uniref:Transmembrane protein, putative n=1 Tax=Medicago truncatula TaxID=3880 RepID=G7J936_MEDTR|nr:transmembrane protein, putative [Medicago truncatula]
MSASQAAGTGGGSALTINIKVEHKFTVELADLVTVVAADSTKAPSIDVEDKPTLESADLEAYVSYFKWWAGLNCVAGYVALAVALAVCDSNPVCHSNPNTMTKAIGYLTSLCGLCLLFTVVTYILSTVAPPATAPAPA